MDGVTLLQQAKEAGLKVTADGDRLVIRGPKRAEPIAKLLIENKPVILQALNNQIPDRPADRPGMVCELARVNGTWIWRTRRPDAADRAFWQWRQAGEG